MSDSDELNHCLGKTREAVIGSIRSQQQYWQWHSSTKLAGAKSYNFCLPKATLLGDEIQQKL